MRRILSVPCAVPLLAMSMLLPSSVARGSSGPLGDVGQRPKALERTAQKVARDLTAQGFEVTSGYPMLWTEKDCDQYTYPILKFCGNDPDSPYVIVVVKSWEDEFVDPLMVNAFGRTRQGYSATYRLDPREAIIVFEELPPPGSYTGMQSWVLTKEWLTEDAPWNETAQELVANRAPDLVNYLFGTIPPAEPGELPPKPSRVLSFSALSDTINNVVIERQSGASFGETRYFIITPDKAMDRTVRSSLELAGVPVKHVFTEPIPLEDEVGPIGPLGLDAKANDFTTWIRYKHPDDRHAAQAWWANLPLTVLRVRERPTSERVAEPFPPFVPDPQTANPETVYADDLDDLARQICLRWGEPCDPDNPGDPDRLRPLVPLQLDPNPSDPQSGGIGLFGPRCRAIGMDCLGDTRDASYFVAAPGAALDDPGHSGWVYAVVGALATATGNATYVGLSVNDLSKLKGVLSIDHERLTGSAASYADTVDNADKLFVHYLARDCGAIEGLTDGQCSTITEDMVPPLGEGAQGLFNAAVRNYVRPGTARAPLPSEQLRPLIIRFAQR